jgi:hypothetical protein
MRYFWADPPLLDTEGLEEMLGRIGFGLKPVPDEKPFKNPEIVMIHVHRQEHGAKCARTPPIPPPYAPPRPWTRKPKPKPIPPEQIPWVPSEPAMPVVAPVSDEEFVTLVFQRDEAAAVIKYRARIDAEIHFNMGVRYINDRDELCKLATVRLERFNLPTDETSCEVYANAYLAYAYYH